MTVWAKWERKNDVNLGADALRLDLDLKYLELLNIIINIILNIIFTYGFISFARFGKYLFDVTERLSNICWSSSSSNAEFALPGGLTYKLRLALT